ncbi:cell division protein FtsX [Halospina denitrificans]|uniref:Cell division protein FtsX n=1 Tax=Halospina denitrificans TaxID=332522 RepID=A0A4R7K225_9GAMM|nr:permease-like cell division protein FtsX [Halospina denitrificans]TDT43973.1 cell division protein FtsX [Halospina denitrificans]
MAGNERKPTGRGAALSRLPWRDQFDSYLNHHRRSARDSVSRLWHSPLSSLMTGLVMGIALALPAALLLLLGSLQSVSSGWDEAARVTVYLAPEADGDRARELRERWLDIAAVRDVELIEKDQALERMKANPGLGRSLDFLEDNPLPHTLVLTPERQYQEAQALEGLSERLGKADGVDRVQLDLAWLQRLNAMADLLRRGAQVLAILLTVGVVLVIANTVRLAIENRRREIIVARLVGGTDAFVRRPFLYTGLWYGVLGGLLAWWLVEVAFWWLSGPVDHLAMLYDSNFSLARPGLEEVGLLLGSSVLLGWLGAVWAVKRHLSEVEPE